MEGDDIAFGDDLMGSIEPRNQFEQNGADTVLVQFPIRSIDGGILVRQVVRQYAVRGNKIDRTVPRTSDG